MEQVFADLTILLKSVQSQQAAIQHALEENTSAIRDLFPHPASTAPTASAMAKLTRSTLAINSIDIAAPPLSKPPAYLVHHTVEGSVHSIPFATNTHNREHEVPISTNSKPTVTSAELLKLSPTSVPRHDVALATTEQPLAMHARCSTFGQGGVPAALTSALFPSRRRLMEVRHRRVLCCGKVRLLHALPWLRPPRRPPPHSKVHFRKVHPHIDVQNPRAFLSRGDTTISSSGQEPIMHARCSTTCKLQMFKSVEGQQANQTFFPVKYHPMVITIISTRDSELREVSENGCHFNSQHKVRFHLNVTKFGSEARPAHEDEPLPEMGTGNLRRTDVDTDGTLVNFCDTSWYSQVLEEEFYHAFQGEIIWKLSHWVLYTGQEVKPDISSEFLVVRDMEKWIVEQINEQPGQRYGAACKSGLEADLRLKAQNTEAVHVVTRSILDYLEQRTIQKLLLFGTGATTLLKQAKFMYQHKPFLVAECADLKLIIQSIVYTSDTSQTGQCESGYCDKIMEKIGNVAYRLQLHAQSNIYHVFHVSLLKHALGLNIPVSTNLPHDTDDIHYLDLILQCHPKTKNGVVGSQLLVKWPYHWPVSLAIWEADALLNKGFQSSKAWGQALFQGGENVRDLSADLEYEDGKDITSGRHRVICRKKPIDRYYGSD